MTSELNWGGMPCDHLGRIHDGCRNPMRSLVNLREMDSNLRPMECIVARRVDPLDR